MKKTLVLLLCIISGCNKTETNKKTDATLSQQQIPIPVPTFNAENAFQQLKKQCEFGPRDPGSKAHEQCLNFLYQQIQLYADVVNLQNFQHIGYKNERLTMTNIIASFNVKATKRILLAAHWDSRPRADRDDNPALRDKPIPGANDGASGVAVLLEFARLLKASPPPVGVDIIFFDGEDYGASGDLDNYFLGARYFASTKQTTFAPRFGILLDMIGDRFLQIPREAFSMQYAPDVVQLVWDTAKELHLSCFLDANGPMVEDDHLPMNEAGIRMIDIIDSELIGGDTINPERNYWHTHRDTPDRCSPQSLESIGTLLAHLIYQKASAF